MDLQQFNLDAAKKGKPLITRDGKEARFIANIEGRPAPIVAEVLIKKDVFGMKAIEKWEMESFFEDGKYLGKHESPLDLFIKN